MNLSDLLFISDLDGTLLEPDATLNPDTAHRINALMAQGVNITFATARTVRSVSHILSDIDFTLSCVPVALMNGVLLRDMAQNRYVSSAVIDPNTAQTALELLCSMDAFPFVYSLDEEHPLYGDPLITCYREIRGEAMEHFYLERVRRYQKPFLHIDHTGDIPGQIIYFCLIAEEETVRRCVRALSSLPGLRLTFYRDSYAENTWYLEAFSPDASKKNAARLLRDRTGAKRVIAFGDNLNDIPLFEAADLAVAVEGAVEEAKAAAHTVTPKVIDFIEQYCKEFSGLV